MLRICGADKRRRVGFQRGLGLQRQCWGWVRPHRTGFSGLGLRTKSPPPSGHSIFIPRCCTCNLNTCHIFPFPLFSSRFFSSLVLSPLPSSFLLLPLSSALKRLLAFTRRRYGSVFQTSLDYSMCLQLCAPCLRWRHGTARGAGGLLAGAAAGRSGAKVLAPRPRSGGAFGRGLSSCLWRILPRAFLGL